MKSRSKCPWHLVLALLPFISYGQTQKTLLQNLSESERTSVEALAIYPDNIRNAILVVSQYPALLVKTKKFQQISQEKFYALVEPYPKEIQQAIWDLTRYPDLIDQLASIPAFEEEMLRSILHSYPSIIHNRVEMLYTEAYDLLAEVAALNQLLNQQVALLYQGEDQSVRDAYVLLIENPDVLSILLQEIELTILVGEVYAEDPEWVIHKADSMRLALANQQAKRVTGLEHNFARGVCYQRRPLHHHRRICR